MDGSSPAATVSERFWRALENQLFEPLLPQEREELRAFLFSKPFLKACRGIVMKAETAKNQLINVDLSTPAGVAKAVGVQSEVRASLQAIGTIVTLSEDVPDERPAS